MNDEEIQFILRMRDEASRILKGLGDTTRRTGNDAEALAGRMDRLSKATREAALAFASAQPAFRIPRAALQTAADYETRMVAIAKTTDQTAQEMIEFERDLDRAARALSGISATQLQEVSAVAGQLGVKGNANILKFSETLNKLATASDVVGEEGASNIARILNLTNTPINEVGKFADVLVELGNNAAATEAEILEVTTTLTQATAKFGIAYEDILAMSATGAELGFRPELFSSVIGRTLIQLENAAKNNTEAMRDFSEMTGITADEFQRLIATDPAQAFDYFLQVIDAIGDEGGSVQGLLQSLGLYAEENQRVLLTLAEQERLRDKNLALARAEAEVSEENGALTKEYERTVRTLANLWANNVEAVALLGKELVSAIGPGLKVALETSAAVINALTMGFAEMDPLVKAVLVVVGQIALAAVPIIATLKLIGTLWGAMPAKIALSTAAIGTANTAAGVLATRLLAITKSLGVLTLAAGAGYGAGKLLREQFLEAYEEGDFDQEGWFYNTFFKEEIIERQASAAGVKASEEIKKAFEETPLKLNVADDTVQGGFRKLGEVDVKPGLLAENAIALQKLDTLSKQTAEIEAQKRALTQLREILAENNGMTGDVEYTNDDVARFEKLIEIAERMADPVTRTTYELDRQLASTQATTQAAKDRLEVEEAILAVLEEKGALSAEEEAAIRSRISLLQEERRNNFVAEQVRELRNSTAIAGQRSSIAREELEVQQQITEMIREQGALSTAQIAEIKKGLETLNLLEGFSALEATLDPIGSALQDYADDAERLNQALAAGLISQERYNQLRSALDTQSLDDRDPLGARLKEMREELSLSRLRGREYEIEKQVLSEVNALKRQGVTVTDEMENALRNYTAALSDLDVETSNGLQAWADDIGTLRENWLQLQEEAATGLTDALVEGINLGGDDLGEALRKFGNNIGRQMVDFAVKGLTRDFLQKTGLGGRGREDALNRANAAASELEGIRDQQIQAATATISTSAVYINGQPLGVPTGPQQAMPANDGGPVTAPAPAQPFSTDSWELRGPIEASAQNVAKGIDMSGVELKGSIDAVSQQVSSATPYAPQAMPPMPQTTGSIGPLQEMGGNASGFTKNITLTPQEIVDLKKTVATEWVQSAGDAQAQGIIDTILNRKASGRWGDSVTEVVNAKSQFSDINGRPAWQKGRNSVDDLPMSRIDARTNATVDQWLQQRSMGAMSSVGDNLNYANPNYSDARNLGWINALEGPVLGRGDAIHRHGTTPELDKYRPGAFGIQMGDQQPQMAQAPMQQPMIDPMTTQSITQFNQQLQQTGMTMQSIAPSTMQLQTGLQQVSTASQGAGVRIQGAGVAINQGGQAAQVAGPQFQQAGTQIQQAGQAAANAGQQANTAVPGMGGFGQGIQSLLGPLTQAVPGLGQFGGAIMNLLGSLGGMGGGGGGGMGIGGIFSSIFSLFHDGGMPGVTKAPGQRRVSVAAFAGAQRYHTGLKNDEFPAILQRGERVLTKRQTSQTTEQLAALQSMAEQGMLNSNSRGVGKNQQNNNVTMQINVKDANSFKKSRGQMVADMGLEMRRMSGRNG